MYTYTHRLSIGYGIYVAMPFLLGGLLVFQLPGKYADGHALADDSGLVTSRFDLSEATAGRPPRPIRSGDLEAEIDQESMGRELSIEPGTQPLLPVDAPAWIGALPDTTGDVHRLHVGGGIAESEHVASAMLDGALVSAVSRYIDTTVLQRNGAAESLSAKITSEYIWKNLIDDPGGYVARLNTSDVPMFQKWVTVSISQQQRDKITAWDREARQIRRLAPVSVGLLGLLSCVGLLHLIFRGRKPRR